MFMHKFKKMYNSISLKYTYIYIMESTVNMIIKIADKIIEIGTEIKCY